MGRIIDETGNRYGRLTVVRRNPENAYHKGANWICRCECGGERVASGIGLRQGLIKSCGCLIRETRVLRCACGYKGQKTRNWTPDWKCYRCSGLSPLQEPPKMTEDEIFEKRVEHWRYYHRSAPTSASHDVMLFLERLEGMTRERDEARADLARSVAAWEAAGMQGRTAHDALIVIAEERDEARAEVERLHLDVGCLQLGLTVASEAYRAGYMAGSREAFRRGAEAMREACAKACRPILRSMASRSELAKTIRALPIPEEP